nr:helix-turn-helix transcriptional regulator [uncultured Blautia sp.]
MSKAAISNYISGVRVPDTESTLKLSLVLETSIEWLLTGKTTNENFSEEEKEIITAYSNAVPAIQEAVRKLLDVTDKSEKSSDLKIG